METVKTSLTKKFSQEFSTIGSQLLGISSKLNSYLLNSQVRVQSKTTTDTHQNYDKENVDCNEDCSQNAPHLEVVISVNRSLYSVNLDPDLVYHSLCFLIVWLSDLFWKLFLVPKKAAYKMTMQFLWLGYLMFLYILNECLNFSVFREIEQFSEWSIWSFSSLLRKILDFFKLTLFSTSFLLLTFWTPERNYNKFWS